MTRHAAGASRSGRPFAPLLRSALAGLLGSAAMSAAGAPTDAAPGVGHVELLDGGLAGGSGGARLAGVEIALPPAAVTYWRSPGDAGVAPVFDFSGSTNLAEARVRYPAPEAIPEAGGTVFGYRDRVVLPVDVTPKDDAQPVTLDIALDYAVCTDLCLPAKAKLHKQLGGGSEAERRVVREALDHVPAPRRLGEVGPLAVSAISPAGRGNLVVHAAATGDATLFAEAPEPWFASAGAGVRGPGGGLDFPVTLSASGPPPAGLLRLTLVGKAGAIEVTVPLDAAMHSP